MSSVDATVRVNLWKEQGGIGPARTDVRTVGCPYCGAREGSPCRRVDWTKRESNHIERVAAYLDSIGAP